MHNKQSNRDSKRQVEEPAAPCPMQAAPKVTGNVSHDAHVAGVVERGEKHMGFSHSKTKHHFFLFQNGGAIQVEVTDPLDATSRGLIRKHLLHVSEMFSNGNFSM